MSTELIADMVSGRFLDPSRTDGKTLSVPVEKVIIADSLKGMEADAVQQLGFDFPLAVVSDRNTHEVLGGQVERAIESLGPIIKVQLGDSPHADMDTVERLVAKTAGAGALIAVGSGTINDLCKMTAAMQNIPCAVFATAPSMNGYTSVNSAITVRGLKKSLASVTPTGVFMDLGILAAAPIRMIRSGLGDSICRTTAQADWLLSHLLFETAYSELPFQLLAEDEEGLLGAPEALVSGDLEAMGRLARTLVLSGFGMSLCGGSYPASQGEHLISHYVEMMHPPEWEAAFHGEQIAVTTMVMARLQEKKLAGPTPVVKASAVTEEDIVGHFGLEIGAACWKEYAKKQLSEDGAEKLNARIKSVWPGLCEKVLSVATPSKTIAAVLERAGMAAGYCEIGLGRDFFISAVSHAHQIRNRYTFLDLADGTGRLDADRLI